MKDDTISRQAAINVANRTDYRGLTVEDVKKVTDEVVKGLEALPPAQPEQHLTCKNCIHLGHAYMMPCKNCKRNQMLPDWYEVETERREE